MISKLERVALREVWKQELDYSRWLQENIEVLNDVLNLSLSSAEREQSAGAFSVDLIAEDDTGNLVVIENQLEKTNHDHLGKLITYLTAFEAKAAVWIAADPRPEHVRAVSWLNESSSNSFYLLKVEAVRIGESPPAPLFTLIVGPSAEGRDVGLAKKDLAERQVLRQRFWETLLQRAQPRTKLHSGVSPGIYSWLGTGAGKRGLTFSYHVRRHSASVELTIDRGKESEAENERIFKALSASRAAVESAIGEPLEWHQVEGTRVCRIRRRIDLGGWRDESKWPVIQDALIDAMIALEKALAPHIKRLPF